MKIKFYALWLVLVCVVMYLLQLYVEGFTNFFILDSGVWTQVWRFLTSMFLHGSISHLLANMFALALFGTLLEGVIGSRRFLEVFLLSGIVANIIAVNFYPLSLGASGAIYGILGALVVLRPMMMIWLYGIPMPLFVAGVIWVVGDTIGLFIPSNVGHIAHLSGIIVGLAFGLFLRDWQKRAVSHKKIHIDESMIRVWEDEYIK